LPADPADIDDNPVDLQWQAYPVNI